MGAAVAMYLITASRELSLEAARGHEDSRLVAGEEVKQEGFVVIDGVVYDVSSFVEIHPGGAEAISEHLGKDISPLFNMLHSSEVLPRIRSSLRTVGFLAPASNLDVVGSGEDQDDVSVRREELPPVSSVVNLAGFERLAKHVLGEDSRAWNFYSSFADDGLTYSATRQSFTLLRFIPRIFVPVAQVSTSTSFLNGESPVPLPIFYAPTGGSAHGHPNGELNVTRAAASTGIPQIVSTMASVAFGNLAKERELLGSQSQLWWQLYVMKDRKESENRIKAAAENGARAIVITVDVAAMGNREVDASPSGKGGGSPSQGVAASSSQMFDADLSWNDIDWVKRTAPGLPVLVKGVASVEDVELAKAHGASGVILSNHGGRQLDGAPPPLATLVHLRRTKPHLLDDPVFDVYIDGGIQRGTDVLKALCIGAKGVGLGRVILYSSACYGPDGVKRATQILQKEIETGMRLLGASRIEDLKPEMIEVLDGLCGRPL
ncbi:cytochrome B2 [Meredithblackwellia eburnea MCA 4105]